MQPSSRRVGGISARSSASRKDPWPGLARRITTRVTAFLGSLAAEPAERRGADLRVDAVFLPFSFAMVAGLYSKLVVCEAGGRLSQALVSTNGPELHSRRKRPRYGWRPAFRLSKFRIVFRTSP